MSNEAEAVAKHPAVIKLSEKSARRLLAGALIIGGAFAWSTFDIMPLVFPTMKTWDSIMLWQWFSALTRFIAGAVVAAGVVNVLMDSRTTMGWVEDRLETVLQRDNYFETLIQKVLTRNVDDPNLLAEVGHGVLERAHANIVRILNENRGFPTDGGFYRTLRTQVEPLLGAAHIELFDETIRNRFVKVDGTPYICSERTRKSTYHARNPTRVDVGLGRTISKIPGLSFDQTYRLRLFSVNGVPYDVGQLAVIDDPSDPNYVVTFEHEVPVNPSPEGPGEKVEVYQRESLLIPAADMTDWRVRDGRSLRQLKVNCRFDGDVFPRIFTYGFPENGVEPKPNEDERQCDIDWKGWMVPHHSFVIKWNGPMAIKAAEHAPNWTGFDDHGAAPEL